MLDAPSSAGSHDDQSAQGLTLDGLLAFIEQRLDDVELTPLQRLKLTKELGGIKKDLATATGLAKLKMARRLGEIRASLGVAIKPSKEEQAEAIAEGLGERTSTSKFYDFDEDRKPAQRKRDNAQAMALIARINEGTLDAAALTDDEKIALAKYSGTGGNLVGADGKKGSAYEYYTPKPIAEGMWSMLRELGFQGGRALDPCGGVGIFGATAPVNAAVDAVELNATSGRVNQLVNDGPGYSTVIAPFEKVAASTPDETYDVVVSNVPFGSVKDRGGNQFLDDKYRDEPIQNYFILRSLEKLKPGGLAAFITPPRCVSGKGGKEESMRLRASYVAEFMGAYRLPNSVFGTAAADTMTDIIIFRKYSREVLTRIEELREQSPQTLIDANVLDQDFINGVYFLNEGKKYILGDPVKVKNRFGADVDALVTGLSIAEIAKLLRKFPKSNVNFELLNATETAPIVYREGDTIRHAGNTLQMQQGRWVVITPAGSEDAAAAMADDLARMTTPLGAVNTGVTYGEATALQDAMVDAARALDIPDWLRGLLSQLMNAPAESREAAFSAATCGLAIDQAMLERQSEETGFNYLEGYPMLSEVMKRVAADAKRPPAALATSIKTAMKKVAIHYSKANGYSGVWRGDVVQAQDRRDAATKFEAQRYQAGGGAFVKLADAQAVMGEDFDPMSDDEWAVSPDGQSVARAADYYVGNYADFLARIDGEIEACTDPVVRDKLLRQKYQAEKRVVKTDPSSMSFTLFSPFVTLEERVQFLQQFVDPDFAVGFDNDGNPEIVFDGKIENERDKLLKRFALYVSGRYRLGLAGIDVVDSEAAIAALRTISTTATAQFNAWVKANPVIMGRLFDVANDPARCYFKQVDDDSKLTVPGLNPEWDSKGYQNAWVRRTGREFSGINGFGVGLGKTSSALIAVQHAQSIGTKTRTVIVVPNSVLSNWKKEAARVYASLDDCLFVGMRQNKKGAVVMDTKAYDEDLTKVLEGRHSKIFMTYEAFQRLRLKASTAEAYDKFLASVDSTYADSDLTKEAEKGKSLRAQLINQLTTDSAKSAAAPYFEDLGIDSIVIDEAHFCFPAGTRVDGRPIETLKVGDIVTSWSHTNLRFERKRVTATMRRKAPGIVRVRISDGTTIACTPNHPIYVVGKGYVAAEFLRKGLPVAINHSETHDTVEMQAVRSGLHAEPRAVLEAQDRTVRSVLLREVLPKQAHVEFSGIQDGHGIAGEGAEDAGCAGREGKLAADAGSLCQEQGGQAGAWVECAQQAEGAGRERPAASGAASPAGRCLELAGGVRHSDRSAARQWLSDLLQGGPGAPRFDDGSGSGWWQPSIGDRQGEGCEEDRIPGFAWVAGVEVQEPGSDGRYGGLCPDGHVYDITVEDNHNFFAEGVLVHNCKNAATTIEFKGGKFLSTAEASGRGMDAQAKCWWVRKDAPRKDGVILLTATPITNSPLEIYSMLTLAVGHDKINNMMVGIKGADDFMEVMCQLENRDEETLDGTVKPYDVFVGLNNVDVLRTAIQATATIKEAADVGEQIIMPGGEEQAMPVALPESTLDILKEYKGAFRYAIDNLSGKSPNRGDPEAFERVAAKFGEPEELIGHPFNLIRKMSALIADPELDQRATFYTFSPAQAEKAANLAAAWNKKPPTDERLRPDPYTKPEAIVGKKTKKDGDEKIEFLVVQARAMIEGNRLVLDSLDAQVIFDFEAMAEKEGIDFDVSVPPKLAALIQNFQFEEANPRGKHAIDGQVIASGRVRQLIFCDNLAQHAKIKRLLTTRCGVAASSIAIITGKINNKPEDILAVQDGFNTEGEDNKFRVVIANEKAEVGINLQKGTQAIHHLTLGWTPDSLTQRNGRGLRQGNQTERVKIYHYDADGTFDTYKRMLVGKKSDWIEAVLSPEGGGNVTVSGGLTRQQQEDLIDTVGDASAMSRKVAEMQARESMMRAASTQGKQAIAVSTVKAQREFIAKFPNAGSWAATKVGAYVTALLQAGIFQDRLANPKATAGSLVKNQNLLAEVKATAAGLKATIEESVLFQVDSKVSWQSGPEQWGPSSLDDFVKYVRTGSFYGEEKKATAAERAAIFVAKGKDPYGKFKIITSEDGAIGNEWASEVDQAESMIDASKSEFARLAKDEGGHSDKLLSGLDDGSTAVMDGKIVCEGAFVQHGDHLGYVYSDTTGYGAQRAKRMLVRYIRADGKDAVVALADGKDAVVALADELRKNPVILPGSAGYDACVTRAAQLEDAIIEANDELASDAFEDSFSAVIPAVAERRTKVANVRYSVSDYSLPSPQFPRFIPPAKVPDGAEVMKAIIAAQAAIAAPSGFSTSYFVASSAAGIVHERPDSLGDLLVAYCKAHQVKMSPADLAHVRSFDYRANASILTNDDAPDFKDAVLAGDATEEALKARMLAWLVNDYLPQYEVEADPVFQSDPLRFLDGINGNAAWEYNRAVARIVRAREDAAAAAAKAAAAATAGTTPEPTPAPAVDLTAEPEMSAGAPVMVIGNTMKWKDTLKLVALNTGRKAVWNGSGGPIVNGKACGTWTVTYSQWLEFLKQNPSAAQELRLYKP